MRTLSRALPILDPAFAKHLAMRGVARDPGVPVVLMHSRGDAGVSKDCGTHSSGLVSAIQAEVGHEVVVDP